MTMKYSASAGGFFDTSLHRKIPDDAVNVRADRYEALLTGQAEGHEIVADKRGRPQLRQFAPATLEAARAACVHAIKREAARRINARMPLWRQLNALRDSTDPGFHEIDAIRQASNLIEQETMAFSLPAQLASFPVADHPIWPAFDQIGD